MTKREMNRLMSKIIEQKDEAIRDLITALRECEVEIDNAIDYEYPPETHTAIAKKNALHRAHNPARIALDAYDKER